tara:strand:- start:2363 stop:2671 length:309 start_codon:yes stop_codon:yes gene_type:complete
MNLPVAGKSGEVFHSIAGFSSIERHCHILLPRKIGKACNRNGMMEMLFARAFASVWLERRDLMSLTENSLKKTIIFLNYSTVLVKMFFSLTLVDRILREHMP